MTLPVLSALAALAPDVRVTIRSGLPESWLRERLEVPFDYVAGHDFGMAMESSLRVRAQATFDYYSTLHRDWDLTVAEASDALRPLEADLLVSNISYVSLAAAQAIGLDRMAYSSLNWADVFWAYCGHLQGARAIRDRMAEAYAAADLFLQPKPSMPMPSILNGRPVSPVVRVGRNRREEIERKLGLVPGTQLMLLSFGGTALPIDYTVWPRLEGWHVVAGSDEPTGHPDVSSWRNLGTPFRDALASADVLVAKPGYGLFTEGVFSGKPILYLPRDGWPETGPLVEWLGRWGAGARIEEDVVRAGACTGPAQELLARPLKKPDASGGAEEVALAILDRLEKGLAANRS